MITIQKHMKYISISWSCLLLLMTHLKLCKSVMISVESAQEDWQRIEKEQTLIYNINDWIYANISRNKRYIHK